MGVRAIRRKEGERDGGGSFLAAGDGLKRGVDDRFDGLAVDLLRQVRFAALTRHER